MSQICQHRELLLKYDSIIFDLDGTLYDSEQFYFGAFEDMAFWLAEKGLQKNKDKWIDCVMGLKKARGNDYHRLIDDALTLLDIDSKNKKILLQLYKAHDCRYLRLAHDDLAVLKYLNNCNQKMFIITNGDRVLQNKKIEKLDLDRYMEDIIILEKSVKDALKPDPGSFYQLAQKNDLGRTIMVGDRFDVDGLFAENSGIDFLGVGFHGN